MILLISLSQLFIIIIKPLYLFNKAYICMWDSNISFKFVYKKSEKKNIIILKLYI